VTAIASRTLAQARAVAQSFDIPKAYETYEALVSDPDIDVIYNPLPNHLHVPWTILAIDAGKHVLCEKPIGLDAADARRLQAATQQTDRLVMEAFMFRFHPQWHKVKELLDTGHIGTPLAIHSIFSHHNDDPTNIRNQAEVGGGALMDLGCYNVCLSRFLLGRPPLRVSATQTIDLRFQVDTQTHGHLDFGDVPSLFTCTSLGASTQRVTLLGSTGRIDMAIPFIPAADQPCPLHLQQGTYTTEVPCQAADHYRLQVDALAQAIHNHTPCPYSLDDAVANMEVLDALTQSAQQNQWVTLT
jgi:predicted dehydrogenase